MLPQGDKPANFVNVFTDHVFLEWLDMGGQSCANDCSTCIATESYVPILHYLYVKFNSFCDDVGRLQRRIPTLSTPNSLNTGTHGSRRTMSTH
jgi:hypothetical protein